MSKTPHSPLVEEQQNVFYYNIDYPNKNNMGTPKILSLVESAMLLGIAQLAEANTADVTSVRTLP
jgi:hypothetical protein